MMEILCCSIPPSSKNYFLVGQTIRKHRSCQCYVLVQLFIILGTVFAFMRSYERFCILLRFSGVVFLSHLKEGEFVPNRIFLINRIPLFMRSLVVSFKKCRGIKMPLSRSQVFPSAMISRGILTAKAKAKAKKNPYVSKKKA